MDIVLDRNLWIASCFGLYLLLILVFAIIYYSLYRRRPQRFFFTAGVQESQLITYTSALRSRIENLAAENEALLQVEERVAKGATLTTLAAQNWSGKLQSGREFTIYFPKPPAEGTTPVPLMGLRDAVGKDLAQVALPTGWPWQRWDEAAVRRRFKNEGIAAVLQRRLQASTLSSDHLWSYWDFVYFSAVCQTTLGFGDILPNATGVRLMVVLQIVLGYADLVVLLNIVFHP
jgi:hypothetical protein